MISENFLIDREINALSIPAQLLFVRMLVRTDDYGILPGDEYTLDAALNLPPQLKRRLPELTDEIVKRGLMQGFIYDGRPYFAMKRDRFDEYQSYLIQKRTRSETLRLNADVMESEKWDEILSNVWELKRVQTKPAAEQQPNGEHAEFTRMWCEAYKDQFKRSYVHGGAKDGMAVKRLLATDGMQGKVARLIDVAKRAWKNPGGFNSKQAATIAGFVSRFNDILVELNAPTPEAKTKRRDGTFGDAPERRNGSSSATTLDAVLRNADPNCIELPGGGEDFQIWLTRAKKLRFDPEAKPGSSAWKIEKRGKAVAFIGPQMRALYGEFTSQ